MRTRALRASTVAVVVALAAGACGSKEPKVAGTKPAAVSAANEAADLRVALNSLQSEHVVLAALATNAALGGRTAEFSSATTALDANSTALAAAFGGAYGDDAGRAFLPLWRKHISLIVAYTNALVRRDRKAQDNAVASLIAYTEDFGAFISSANEQLTKEAVAGLVKTHILTLKNVIDAQAGRKPAGAAKSLREAYAHMSMIAGGLGGATARKFSDRFEGSTETPAVELRVGLDNLLREHVWLAAWATGAALDGRNAEFDAAATALDGNSDDIVSALGSVYAEDAEAFGALWKSHIGFVVRYTKGLAAGNRAQSDKAVADLLAYTDDFGAFLASMNPNLKKATVAGLVKEHVLGLKAVIDAQAADNFGRVYTGLRTAARHMNMLGDALSEAILKHHPEKFQDE